MKLKRDRVLNWIGFGLLAVCFVVSLQRVFTRTAQELDSETKTIRFAHWQLEGGIREAFDVLAEQYMRRHPNVRVIQLPIPEVVYPTWIKTQLVGQTAPDLIQLGMGSTTEDIARYFRPLGELISRPNPYNAGTELEGIPWSDTFVDGLVGGVNYSSQLMEHYAVSMSMFTVRIYYNRALMRAVTGKDRPPQSYDEFVSLCRAVERYAAATGKPVIPIASSKYNASPLIKGYFITQTQQFNDRWDVNGDMRADVFRMMAGFVRGEWSLETPDMRSAIEIVDEVGQFLQPGFLQLGREDSLFVFSQGNALMVATGSWDSSSIFSQSPFEVGVFDLPYPRPSHPRFGKFVKGPNSEASTNTGASFGLTSFSRHPETAVDFLHFMTSQGGNQTFADVSGWLPSVVGVDPQPQIEPFMPREEGYVNGVYLDAINDADIKAAYESNLYVLFSPEGTVDGFIRSSTPAMKRAIPQAIARDAENQRRNIQSQDSALYAFHWLAQNSSSGVEANRARVGRLLDSIARSDGVQLIKLDELESIEPGN